MAVRESVSRRDFLNRSVVVSGGALFTIGMAGCGSKSAPALSGTMDAGTDGGGAGSMEAPSDADYRKPVADLPELAAVGGVTRVQDSGYDFYLVRKSESEVIALENICTHAKCPTNYQADSSSFLCPCHRSQFDLDGNVSRGPANKTLNRFNAALANGVVSVVFS